MDKPQYKRDDSLPPVWYSRLEDFVRRNIWWWFIYAYLGLSVWSMFWEEGPIDPVLYEINAGEPPPPRIGP